MSRFFKLLRQALAVLAILFVTALFLFPYFAKAREHEGQPYCASNMKQLGLGLVQYVQDNDEMMPNISDRNGNTWRTAIFPYVKSRLLFQCPDRKQDDPDANPIGADGYPESYAANYTGDYGKTKLDQGRGAFAGSGSWPVEMRDIPHPEALIMFMEATDNPFPDFNIDASHTFSQASPRLWAGHQGGSNFLLMDGHIKWMRPLQTYRASNDKVIQNLWYRNGAQPLSANGVAVLQDAQQRFQP